MIDITIRYLIDKKIKNVGLLSTTGTRKTNLYLNKLKNNNINLIQIPDKDQDIIQDLIFNKNYGIKALSSSNIYVRNKFMEFITYIKNKGAKAVILGCTEIPIAIPEEKIFNVKIINPLVLLAREMIKVADKDKLLNNKLPL